MDETLISTGDVARKYGVSASTIRRWIKQGRLGFVMVGTDRLKTRRTLRVFQEEADRLFRHYPPALTESERV